MAEANVSTNTVPQNVVYQYLKNQILTMELCPGDKLSENKLSADMEVGRPLVRDALAQLSEEGYVVVYPQKGTEVSRIDLERVRQAIITHNVFEQAIAKELCGKELTEEQNAEIDAILYDDENDRKEHKKGHKEHKVEEKDDALEIMMIEQQLKYTLAKICGRAYVWDMFRTMDCDMLRVNHLQYSVYNYRSLTFSLTGREYAKVEWRMLIDNIRRGNAEEAALVCSNHYNAILLNAESLKRIFPQYFTE